MFTGIVEAIAQVRAIRRSEDNIRHFSIELPPAFTDFTVGASVAVNGVCLTVTYFTEMLFEVTAVPETLRLTNLGQLAENSLVNLERPLTLQTRLGGHLVQGHVDAVSELLTVQPDGNQAITLTLSVPAHLAKYIVNKGYVALDGMSLTVINATDTSFTVMLIPHTQHVTRAHQYQEGTLINLEVDILAKYIEKLERSKFNDVSL